MARRQFNLALVCPHIATSPFEYCEFWADQFLQLQNGENLQVAAVSSDRLKHPLRQQPIAKRLPWHWHGNRHGNRHVASGAIAVVLQGFGPERDSGRANRLPAQNTTAD